MPDTTTSLTDRLRDLGVPEARLTARFSRWSFADQIYRELVAVGVDPDQLVAMARDCRTGADAVRLFNDPANPWAHLL